MQTSASYWGTMPLKITMPTSKRSTRCCIPSSSLIVWSTHPWVFAESHLHSIDVYAFFYAVGVVVLHKFCSRLARRILLLSQCQIQPPCSCVSLIPTPDVVVDAAGLNNIVAFRRTSLRITERRELRLVHPWGSRENSLKPIFNLGKCWIGERIDAYAEIPCICARRCPFNSSSIPNPFLVDSTLLLYFLEHMQHDVGLCGSHPPDIPALLTSKRPLLYLRWLPTHVIKHG